MIFRALGKRISDGSFYDGGTSIANSQDLLRHLQGGFRTPSGVRVSPRIASTLSYFSACKRVLSTGASLAPLTLYRREGERSKGKAKDHRLYPRFRHRPSRLVTIDAFLRSVVGNCIDFGNFFAFKHTVAGELDELEIIDPLRLPSSRPELDSMGRPIFMIRPENGRGPHRPFGPDEVLHIPSIWPDETGWWGQTPVRSNARTLGLALAQRETAERFFTRNINHGVALQMPGGVKLGTPRADKIKDTLQALAGTGPDAIWELILLEHDMKLDKVTMTPEEAQMGTARLFQGRSICRIVGVDPGLVADLQDQGKAIAEQLMVRHVLVSLLPWWVAIQNSMTCGLLMDPDDLDQVPEVWLEFLHEALMRGDTKSLVDALEVEFRNGWLTLNEIRQLRNRSPFEDMAEADEPMVQNLFVPGSKQVPGSGPAPNSDDDEDEDE